MRALKTLFPLLLALAAMPLVPRRVAAAAGPWESNPQSSLRLISPWQVAPVSPDGELRLGLHFKLAPGWHVYWKNSGDAGFPPVVVFGETLESAELLWPAPERFELRGGLVAFGYADEVVYPVRAKLRPPVGAAGPLRISADVDYLVCADDCVPYRYTLTLDQPLGASPVPPVPDPATAPLVDAWWRRLPVTAAALPGVTTDGVLEQSGPLLEVRLHGARPAPGTAPGLFLESHETFDTGKPEPRVTADGVIFRVPLKARESGKPFPRESTFAWTATGLAGAAGTVSLEARRAVPLSASPAAPSIPAKSAPVLIALLAVAATLAALWLWGLLDAGEEPGAAGSRTRREALGFAAAAVVCGALWGMSRQVSFLGLAWIELLLLAMALCAWLRRRMSRRRTLGFLLALGVAACAAAAPWLAHRNRLTLTTTPRQEDSRT